MQPINIPEIVSSYSESGYFFPIQAMDSSQAQIYRSQLEALEVANADIDLGNKNQLNFPHVIFQFANEIVRNSRILDVVEALIGPNILVWGSTFFIKEPHTDSFVSWHQDLRYWGLKKEDEVVSAWLALSPVNQANGCMRFLPKTHTSELLEHNDTFDDKNFLTRGQEANVDINEAETVHVELQPGEVSFHHGRLLHASASNNSDQRRIGLAINYISTQNRQVVAKKDFGMLVRGVDNHRYFEHVPPPDDDMSDQAMAWHNNILTAQNEALYDGAKQI